MLEAVRLGSLRAALRETILRCFLHDEPFCQDYSNSAGQPQVWKSLLGASRFIARQVFNGQASWITSAIPVSWSRSKQRDSVSVTLKMGFMWSGIESGMSHRAISWRIGVPYSRNIKTSSNLCAAKLQTMFAKPSNSAQKVDKVVLYTFASRHPFKRTFEFRSEILLYPVRRALGNSIGHHRSFSFSFYSV